MVAKSGNTSSATDLDLSVEDQIELCWQQYHEARADAPTSSTDDVRLEAQLQTRGYLSDRALARRLQPPSGNKLWRTLGHIINGKPAGLDSTGEWALN
jgi:hypothetical protein